MNITSHLSVSSKRLKNCDTIIKRLYELKLCLLLKIIIVLFVIMIIVG